MPWRNWSVVVVLVLANYVVFSILAALVFPVKPAAPLKHTAAPTFTPGAPVLQRVGTLTYDFLTPSPTANLTLTRARSTISPTSTFTATATVTDTTALPAGGTPGATAEPATPPSALTPTLTATPRR